MTVTPLDIATAARTLLVGATGTPPSTPVGPQLHVEDPTHLSALVDDIDRPATVFTAADHVDTVAQLVPGTPIVVVDGDIGALDDLYLEPGQGGTGGANGIAIRIQDYASSPYVSILGTTLVRVDGIDDVEAFLADADDANDSGAFAQFIVHPAVELADSGEIDGPATRLSLHVDGSLSVSPFAPGTAASGVAPVDPLRPLIADAIGSDEWSRRPWLPRYLRAVRVLRRVGANGHADARVSGFGGRLDESAGAATLPDADLRDPDRPIVAFTRDTAFVAHGDALVRCSREAGAIVENLIRHEDHRDRLASVSADGPEHRLVTALESQGISFGIPVGGVLV